MQSERKKSVDLGPRSIKARMRNEFRVWGKKIIGPVAKFVPNVQRRIEQGVTVFAFHDISDQPSQFTERYGLVVSTNTFERQIRWIRDNFDVVPPSAILSTELLPRRAAVVSFDDGFRGTFENGLPILEKLNIPSIVFLNMQPILLGKPILSAMSCYLSETELNFTRFCKQAGLESPFHLSLNPRVWEDYKRDRGYFDISAVGKYQGEFVDMEILRRWDGHSLVSYGNHLFEHWNAAALSSEELKDQYLNNERALSDFAAKVNLFAFTNGQPVTCFTKRDIELLKALGAGRVFSTAGGINQNSSEFLLGRIALSESDHSDADLWFRVSRGGFNDRRI